MKKLLLTFLGGVICCLNLMAADVTLGITRTIAASETTTDKKTSGAAVTGKAVSNDNIVDECDGVTVALAHKVESDMTDKARNTYWYSGSSIMCYVDKGVHNYRNKTTTLGDDNYFAFTVDIAVGKELNIKSINGDIMMDGDKTSYQMAIVNAEGTEVYTSQTKACNKSGSALKQVSVSDLAEDVQKALTGMTGKITVKLRWTNTANTGKYCVIKDFNIVAEVGDAAAQTQYKKPTITLGAYDKVNGTYSVTLVGNDGDAVVNYTVGSEAKVTGVESGTIINVAPNTKIVATASGSSYTESDEQTLTTAAAPKVAMPTNAIGAYNFATNTYSVTLNGTGVMYKIGEGAWTAYTETLNVPVKTQVQAKGTETNMSESEVLSFSTFAPPGGNSTTPPTATYTDGMTYNARVFTIPSTQSYIGGQISSGNSSINGAIKMRISRYADPAGSQDRKYGFHILVNSGNTLSSVSLQMLNNYDTQIALTGVYVDNGTDNLLDEPVALPYASAKTVAAAVATVSGISATQKVVFVFEKTSGTDNPNQAQIIISATSIPAVDLNMNLSAAGYSTFSCCAPVKIEGAKAYKATINAEGDKLVCTEIENGLVPAGEGVLLFGEAGAAVTASYDASAPAVSDNSLKATTLADGSLAAKVDALVLSGNTFLPYNGAAFAANKAYLPMPAGAKGGFSIVFDDDNTTAVAGVAEAKAEVKTVKLMTKDGLLIKTANGIVNAAGAQVK